MFMKYFHEESLFWLQAKLASVKKIDIPNKRLFSSYFIDAASSYGSCFFVIEVIMNLRLSSLYNFSLWP
jgi:hypothetical protein